jgi:hypothetical protein
VSSFVASGSRQSRLGTASFVLGIAGLIAWLVTWAASSVAGAGASQGVTVVIGLVALVGIICLLVGLILGVVGLLRAAPSKRFALYGTILNALVLLAAIVVWVGGGMMTS